ncbi:hypothetical protein JSE7799_02758 [Jannaschia seosinensis]|uniref:Uncharacterized protein n=1 Tax=Jannaschia seosinensis TaxID=313367 RepID=A0A0M7BCW5_9RHOB|nr:hypothetical protein JSE7799_02758 [Jannaschia seosinensis]
MQFVEVHFLFQQPVRSNSNVCVEAEAAVATQSDAMK